MSSPALRGGGLPRTVLRLHRSALLAWAVFVAGASGWLVWLAEVTGKDPNTRDLPCVGDCDTLHLLMGYPTQLSWAGDLIGYGFVAVAGFAGGSLIGRELEYGTAQLAWTQGITPVRWLTAKLALPALAVTAGGTILVLVFRWVSASPPDPSLQFDWTWDTAFMARGPLLVAYALCALAVGVLTGLLLRRALAALGAAAGAMWLLNAVLTSYRFRLWPAVTRTGPHAFDIPDNVALVNEGGDGDSRFATYQPPSHYWPLHLTETAIVLTVAALAVLLSFRLLKHRTEPSA
ncbi:hypothetical protein [Streptomyces fuscichromogenes]|uniref:ABC transporter permease n=1 Tax=Streptomyces fuscichromogenes TaxID=1324013 RepID=A0A917XGY0_9ACTN|nr:hypothetical protein [Streptomyces fuscichromogenes]GGN25419.1 hypothetical protein GCM10011578_059280 [Streptomyces fuscichromogenes]